MHVSKHQDQGMARRDRRADETPEVMNARASYNSWRSLIRKLPRGDDLYTMQALWDGALGIRKPTRSLVIRLR
jgi:hypothetical protein